MDYRLVLANAIPGMLTRGRWTLELPASIGRSPDNEVCINHNSISRTHCRLALNGEGALVVRDLNSTNGTYVDDQKVTQTLLTPGDTLQIGSVMLRIEYATDSEQDEIPEKPEAYDLSATAPMRLKDLSASDEDPPPRKWWRF